MAGTLDKTKNMGMSFW